MPTEVVVGLFTLAGVALGFAGQWVLEHQRWDRARRTAVMAVLFEISLLAETLERAAKERERTRESLRTDWWDEHGPELVNYLPGHFVKALHLLYYDLDRLQHWYSRFTAGIDSAVWKQMAAMFLGWAYQAEWVAARIDEHNRQRHWHRLWMWRVGKRLHPEEDAQRSKKFIGEAYEQAMERLRAEGLAPDEKGSVVEANER